jgi:hypothetical protein
MLIHLRILVVLSSTCRFVRLTGSTCTSMHGGRASAVPAGTVVVPTLVAPIHLAGSLRRIDRVACAAGTREIRFVHACISISSRGHSTNSIHCSTCYRPVLTTYACMHAKLQPGSCVVVSTMHACMQATSHVQTQRRGLHGAATFAMLTQTGRAAEEATVYSTLKNVRSLSTPQARQLS